MSRRGSEIGKCNFSQAGEFQAHPFLVAVGRSHHYSPTSFIIMTVDALSSSVATGISIVQLYTSSCGEASEK